MMKTNKKRMVDKACDNMKKWERRYKAEIRALGYHIQVGVNVHTGTYTEYMFKKSIDEWARLRRALNY